MKSIEAGYEKNVVILTQNEGYVKKPFGMKKLARIIYRKYPKLCEALENRHKKYNETLELIEELEKEGKVFVIRPINPIKVGRMERKSEKLQELYEDGYNEGKRIFESMEKWLNGN